MSPGRPNKAIDRDIKPSNITVTIVVRRVVDAAGHRRQLAALDRLLAEPTPDEGGVPR